jgi:hypothetical protein
MDLFWLGGEGPQSIPPWAYVYLVATLKVPPQDLIGLRSVQRIGFWQGKPACFVRIYDPHASEEAWRVTDFTSLDEHPELIFYEGYRQEDNGRVFLQRGKAKPKLQPHPTE